MGILYLAALVVSIGCMVLIDARWRLFFWAGPLRAAITLIVGVVFFLAWDLVGIGLGVFFRGETSFMTGIQVAPELPLEEVFFLTLLCYLAMNGYRALELGAKAISGLRRHASADGRLGRRYPDESGPDA